jgi:diguanylate cyclase (GGDEF)-like protein
MSKDKNGWRNYRSPSKRRIKQLEKRNYALKELCTHDRLTGLLKSDVFEKLVIERTEKMSHKMRAPDTRRVVGPITIIYIDVDHFKLVNDTLGHDAGDEILQILADIIRDEDLVVRRSDAGDEFLIALFDINEVSAGERLVEMRTQFETASLNEFPNLGFVVSFSFGVEEMPLVSEDMSESLKMVERSAWRKMQMHKHERGMEREIK